MQIAKRRPRKVSLIFTSSSAFETLFGISAFNWREHVGIEPTQVGLTTYTGFEDQRAHQLPIYSQGGLNHNIPVIF